MTYNAFHSQGHFLVAQALGVVSPTLTFNIAIPLVGLTPYCGLQEFVCNVLIFCFIICRQLVIIGMLAFIFCILSFGSWLHLLDRSQYSVSTYITYKVPDFHTNWILVCQQNLAVNLSKCYVSVCIVLQEGHLANVSGHLVCKLYGQHNPIKVLQHQLLVVQKCTDICEVSNKLESKQLLQR